VTPDLQTLQKEIAGHQPRYDDIFQRSQQVVRGISLLLAGGRRISREREVRG
jgi:hypothetical protein